MNKFLKWLITQVFLACYWKLCFQKSKKLTVCINMLYVIYNQPCTQSSRRRSKWVPEADWDETGSVQTTTFGESDVPHFS